MHDRIYLAGPISNKSDANTWREIVEDWYSDDLSVHVVNPLNDRLPNGSYKFEVFNRPDIVHANAEEIVQSDLQTIDECSGMLVNWEEGTQAAGTSMEVFYAKQNNVKVALIFDGDEKQLSPWLIYHSDQIFDSLKDGMKFLISREENSNDNS